MLQVLTSPLTRNLSPIFRPLLATLVPASGGVTVPDETLVAQLVSMGFSEQGCKRAAIATSNAGVEAAMEWVFAHMGDPDFNDPLPEPAAAAAAAGAGAGAAAGGGSGAGADADPEKVGMLTGMGFNEQQAKAALLVGAWVGVRQSGGSLRLGGLWLSSAAEQWPLGVAEQWLLGEAEQSSLTAGRAVGVECGRAVAVGGWAVCGRQVRQNSGRWVW